MSSKEVEIKKAGNMRVKQNPDRKPMSDHTLINRFVKDINSGIKELNDLQYAKFRDHTHQLLKNYISRHNRKLFKHRKDFALFRDGKDKYFYSEMFYAGNKFRLYLKEDLEGWAKKAYNNAGLDNLNKFLFVVASSMEKKSYISKDPGTFYNEERFNEACDTLGVKRDTKVLFSEVRRCYEGKLEEVKAFSGLEGEKEDLRSKVNEAFILIRKQYPDYLEELTPKLPNEILIPSDKIVIEDDEVKVLDYDSSDEEEDNELIPKRVLEVPENMIKEDS